MATSTPEILYIIIKIACFLMLLFPVLLFSPLILFIAYTLYQTVIREDCGFLATIRSMCKVE